MTDERANRPLPALPALLALLAVAGVTLAACGDDDDAAAPTTAPAAAATTTATTTATTGPATTGPATTGPAATTAAPTSAGGPTVVEVSVVGGKPVGGVGRVTVAKGTEVTVRITVDEAQAVHAHGIDLEVEATPARPADIRFTADAGPIELESHDSGELLAVIDVA